MADKPSAALSGALLARKGAASADGFALAGESTIAPRRSSSYRWRIAVFSATLALSVGVIAFVAGTLTFIDTWGSPDAPGRTADVPAAIAPVSPVLAAAPSAETAPKQLAVAIAADVGKQHAEKIMAAATPDPEAASEPVEKPEPAFGPVPKEEARRTASIPPRPKQRPRHFARAAYRVQLHALVSDAAVRREWRRLRKRHGALLSGLKLTVSPMRAGGGAKTVYRMQLGALSSRARARALCAKLRRRKMSCMVVR